MPYVQWIDFLSSLLSFHNVWFVSPWEAYKFTSFPTWGSWGDGRWVAGQGIFTTWGELLTSQSNPVDTQYCTEWSTATVRRSLFFSLQNLDFFGISLNNLNYLDKQIKCLEMRANIKSVQKNNDIFICIFTYI